MEIFGKHIFGTCAEGWLKMCKDKKREWILKRTSQRNEELITELINNQKISKDCACLDCGKHKENESNGISKETTSTIKSINNSVDSRKNSAKRSKKS